MTSETKFRLMMLALAVLIALPIAVVITAFVPGDVTFIEHCSIGAVSAMVSWLWLEHV